MDVVYLTNAEVERFNGCGFCKWIDIDPPAKTKGYSNPGWPGCCRPPLPGEYSMIQAAEWKAVNAVHGTPIPPDIERLLASLTLPPTRAPSTAPASPKSTSKPSTPARKVSAPSKPSVKPLATPSPNRGRSPIAASATVSRTPSAAAISSSVPNSSSVDAVARRKTASGAPDRRGEGTQSNNSSPSRKSLEIDSPTNRSPSTRRPVLTPATTSVSVSRVVAADSRAPRRPSISTTATAAAAERKEAAFLVPRGKDEFASSASSSSGSSDGMGSLSDSTVTSDGGFTDYLSDESEAELQRQAEARAVVLAQNQAEELEFKIARQQLASVGLKPPKLWNPGARAIPAAGAARNGLMSPTSFTGAATAMMQTTGQARD
ncbi:hypothetical protein HYPSUDRAFT_31988 [Hypholoma sublateritium FD-334 SS-4]|uniref:Uncharacterized protein n=1 Tax=Hypholoma sublateritium (strain FD-334 SS-4) TaxID=945553 RepID=A0A0D2PP12_HYPSF|nr:hypothetical protein HYPSUDRAFT_31988 [Hypholoma sublateritium FD-334 SS-4]